MPFPSRTLPLPGVCLALLVAALLRAPPAPAAPRCTDLEPIGGDGRSPIVAKQVGPISLIGKTNWDTDFIVDRAYASYLFRFTANSSRADATYPVSGAMKFSDGSSLRLFEQTIRPGIGGSRSFGPYPAVPGKKAVQMNMKVGGGDPASLGLSYRIGVQGCDR
jgi:hypothetical protein